MASTKLVSAEAMHRAVTDDPQFRCPRRPALCRGLVVVPLPDGILVEGGPSRQVLRGQATRDLVPTVLPFLDGTLDHAGIAARAGVPQPHVERLLALLYTCGLLEEGMETPVPDLPATPFWSRSLDSTRVNTSTAEVWQRLATARIAVAGDPELGSLLCEELVAAGIGHAVTTGMAPAGGPYDLVLGVARPIDAPDGHPHDDLDDPLLATSAACAADGVPFLPLRITGDMVEIGPYIDLEFTAGYPDAEAQRLASPATDSAATLPCGLRGRLAAALASAQAVSLITRVGTVPALRGLLRIDLATWTQRLQVIAPRPAPPASHVSVTAAGVPLSLVLESSVAFSPRRLLNPRAHQVHFKPANLALQYESKRWPSAPVLTLDGQTATPAGALPPWPPDPGTAPSGPVPLGDLAAILQRGAGLRPDGREHGKLQRWAPTGGNLGSVQLHVLARQVTGLQAGLWGYDVRHHQLARLSDRNDPGHPDPDAGRAAAVIVLTAALARIASKYNGFAWRVIHLDAGVALAQMSITAAALGHRARPLNRWDDLHLGDQLDIDLDTEPVTGVLLIGAAGTEQNPAEEKEWDDA